MTPTPASCTIDGKSLKPIIHLHCLITPKPGNLMTPDQSQCFVIPFGRFGASSVNARPIPKTFFCCMCSTFGGSPWTDKKENKNNNMEIKRPDRCWLGKDFSDEMWRFWVSQCKVSGVYTGYQLAIQSFHYCLHPMSFGTHQPCHNH